ncbi:MAG: thioredoxin family protein [Flavobacteriaceae bacterium]
MHRILALLFFLISTISWSQEKTELKVHSFPEVERLHKQTPKPIVVFVHTDWCKYCHAMQKTTFINEKVIALLNESFYFVKLNGEEKKNITFLGKTFVYKPHGNSGTHELAIELATKRKRVAYPTTVILDKEFAISVQLVGLINKRRMTSVLKRAKKL